MGRAPCCDKSKVKKGPWSPDEDAKLKSHIQNHGTGGNWIALPNKIGLKRCGKSCRLRWLNYLRPNLKHGGFTAEEDNLICNLYVAIGSRWSVIAAQLPGRTDNDIKNYWNTRLKKKLFAKQRRSFVTAAAAKTLPPPPPPPLLADHAPIDVEQIGFSNFNNFEADFRCAWENSGMMNPLPLPLPLQPEMYGATPQAIDAAAAAVNSSAAIWEEMNCLSYYNHQLFDERLLGYSQ